MMHTLYPMHVKPKMQEEALEIAGQKLIRYSYGTADKTKRYSPALLVEFQSNTRIDFRMDVNIHAPTTQILPCIHALTVNGPAVPQQIVHNADFGSNSVFHQCK